MMSTRGSQHKGPQDPGIFKPARLARGFVILWIAFLYLNSCEVAKAQQDQPGIAAFRIAFSGTMFTNVNESDARAAVKVWAQTVAKEQGIKTDPDPSIITGTPAISQALKSNLVDAVGMTTGEYALLSHELKLAPIFVTYVSGRIDAQYILLVHRDSGIETIDDLKGRSLGLYQNPRASLAPIWLDTVLFQKGFRPKAAFFGQVAHNNKLPHVILPVFFRQRDACLVTRSGFETMNELNPQIGKQLKIMASSPELVPAVFCFRADYSPPFKAKLFSGISELHTTPAGQQVLTIFNSERIEAFPPSILQNSLDLIETHRRLSTSSKDAATIQKSPLRTAKQNGG